MWVRKVGRRRGRVETLGRRREGRKSESLSSPCLLYLWFEFLSCGRKRALAAVIFSNCSSRVLQAPRMPRIIQSDGLGIPTPFVSGRFQRECCGFKGPLFPHRRTRTRPLLKYPHTSPLCFHLTLPPPWLSLSVSLLTNRPTACLPICLCADSVCWNWRFPSWPSWRTHMHWPKSVMCVYVLMKLLKSQFLVWRLM